MLRTGLHAAAAVIGFSALAVAQFPPALEGVTVLESKFGDGVKISYKEVSDSDFTYRGETQGLERV